MSEVAVAGIRARAAIPVALAGTASRYHFAAEVLRGTGVYDTLLPEWRRLAKLQPGAILFQTPTLLATWARHFAPGENALATVVLRHAGRPVLIWPLMVERRGLVRVARGAGAPIGQYDEILVDPTIDMKAALRVALEALKQAVRPDAVLFESVRFDSMLHAALRDVPHVECNTEGAPYIDLSNGLASALARRKSYAAKQQRKRMKRFAKAGTSTLRLPADPAEAEAWLNEALTMKRAWLRENGLLSRAFVKAKTGNCLAELALTLTGSGASPRMVVAKLTLDERTAAIEAGFIHRSTFHLYLRAFAPEFSLLGPGNVLTERMLEWCAQNAIERYDMLAPRSRNKAEWQSGEVCVGDFALPMTWRGRVYAATVPALLTPMLRDAFYALPATMRSAIAGITLRM